MGPPTPMPHIEPSLYNWRPSTKTQNLYLRRALGVEKKWALQAPGPRQMFLSGSFTLTGPYSALSLEVFGKAAKRAWLRVRCEFPEVVLGPSSELWDDGSIFLELEIPGSDGEAEEWMRRSLYFGICEEGKSAEEEMRQAVIRDPVCVRLNARVDQESKVAGAEFVFRVDHAAADGVGAYIVVANFLNFLAHAIGGREETFDWTAPNGKFPMPWVGMMNADQKTEGKEFEDGVKKLTSLVMDASKSEWGMKVLSEDEYTPEAIHKRFSVEESNAILLAVKKKLGKACSVTHLGHAAMVMTMLKFKPVQERPAHDARFVSPLFINGRRYLDQGVPGSRNYISLCRAVSAIELRDVETYILSEQVTEKEVQEKLRLACTDVFRSYQAVRGQKSVLTESFSMDEYMAMAKNDSKAFKGKGTADAYFLSDGLIERHVSTSHYDEPQTHKVFEVDDMQFSANPDGPSLVIRMSTFRQAINLSAEWNGACYLDEDIRKFLDSVADLMRSLTRDEIA